MEFFIFQLAGSLASAPAGFYSAKHNGIPDEKHRVLKLYGQEFKPLKLGRMPAQILVDKEGIVRYVHYGQAMDDIAMDQDIFDLIDKLYSVVS